MSDYDVTQGLRKAVLGVFDLHDYDAVTVSNFLKREMNNPIVPPPPTLPQLVEMLGQCQNCRRIAIEHASGKCLFGPENYKPMLAEIIEQMVAIAMRPAMVKVVLEDETAEKPSDEQRTS